MHISISWSSPSCIIFFYFFFAATHSLRCPPQLHQRRRQLRHPAPHSPALQCRVRISRRKFANFMIVENCGFLHIDDKFIKIWNGNYIKCNYMKCNFIWNETLYQMWLIWKVIIRNVTYMKCNLIWNVTYMKSNYTKCDLYKVNYMKCNLYEM